MVTGTVSRNCAVSMFCKTRGKVKAMWETRWNVKLRRREVGFKMRKEERQGPQLCACRQHMPSWMRQ